MWELYCELFEIHLNITLILPSISRSSRWPLSSSFSHRDSIHIYLLNNACTMTLPFLLLRFIIFVTMCEEYEVLIIKFYLSFSRSIFGSNTALAHHELVNTISLCR